MENKIVAFESKFGQPEKFNSQFHMVKVYIAYAGKNRNYSIISKETFEKMIPSLYGVPVVGEWKGDDYGSHGGKIEISEDGVEYVDTTKPYGFIDSSATVQWEKVIEEDGTEREYLTTTAFLWTERYPEALKVLENKNNQSMELSVIDGKISEEYPEYFEILDGEFSALCILGENTEPCFESAKVSQFNLDKDTFKTEFAQMVKELKESMSFTNNQQTKDTLEGGESMSKIESMFATYNQKREALRNAFDSEIIRDKNDKIIEETYYWVADFDDEYVYVERDHWKDGDYETNYGRFTYTFDEEKIEATITSEFEKMILVWLTEEENQKIQEDRNNFEKVSEEYKTLQSEKDSLQENYSKLERELKDLRSFKQDKLDKERKEQESVLFEQYKELEDVEEFITLKEKSADFTIENLEKELALLYVKSKANFSLETDKNNTIKVGVQMESEEDKPESPYGDLFDKYTEQ